MRQLLKKLPHVSFALQAGAILGIEVGRLVVPSANNVLFHGEIVSASLLYAEESRAILGETSEWIRMNMELNFFPLLLAGVVSMILGFAWYSPLFLGKTWMKERKFTEASLKKAQSEMSKLYVLSFVVTLISAFVLTHMTRMSLMIYDYSGWSTGLITAFWMWLGFMLPVQVTNTLFSDEKNWKLLAIDTGYQLVSLLAMGMILGWFL